MHLNNLNLSYNQLSIDNLSKHIFQISKQFLRIKLNQTTPGFKTYSKAIIINKTVKGEISKLLLE